MEFSVIGINHQTSTLAERESRTIPAERQTEWLNGLRNTPGVHGVVYLSTCNRVELYTAVEPEVVWNPMPFSYQYRNGEAFAHLLRVACGLDSMVLGETQVFGQLKEAYQRCLTAGVTGGLLNFAFQQAFCGAKQIRSETGINRFPTSVGSVGMMLLEQIYGEFKNRTGLVIGLGEMGSEAAKLLAERNVGKLLVMNRSRDKAEEFVRGSSSPGEVVSFGAWEEALPRADFVVTATGAVEPILSREIILRHFLRDGDAPRVLLDLGVPRDVDPALGQAPGLYLYNVDDLKTIANQNRSLRETEAKRAEAMVERLTVIFKKQWEARCQMGVRSKFVLVNSIL